MNKLFALPICALAFATNAQIKTPQLSPPASFKQTVGLTEIEIVYARPGKRDRIVFGDVVPLDQMWRTGANKNTTITTSDILVFGKDTLKAGTYAIFTKPMKSSWEMYFYTDTENWGTPDEWKAELVALTVSAPVIETKNITESFTISIDAVGTGDAILSFSWDKTLVNFPFQVATDERVAASIKKVMAGPSADDYYKAADYYLSQKKELTTALDWINKAIEMKGEAPFWMLRKKALIQAELKDYKGAIETAQLSLEAATKAKNDSYITSNQKSIEEWSKLVK